VASNDKIKVVIMIIKCNRKEIKLNSDDRIMFNGTDYRIITKDDVKIAKAKMIKLIKSKKMVEIVTTFYMPQKITFRFYKIYKGEQ